MRKKAIGVGLDAGSLKSTFLGHRGATEVLEIYLRVALCGVIAGSMRL